MIISIDTAALHVVDAVLDSIKPWWGSSLTENMLRQGNWPAKAEYAVALLQYNREWYNKDCNQHKFFNSKVEFEEYVKETQEWAPGSNFGCTMICYGWDLGPYQISREVLN